MHFKPIKILRYYHTIKYLKPIQNYTRVKLILATRVYKHFSKLTKLVFWDNLPKQNLRNSCFLTELKKVQPHSLEYNQIVNKAESIVKGEYTFLNQQMKFDSPDKIGWNSPELSQLWRYNLHYFDYVWDLGIAYIQSTDKKYYDCFKLIVKGWIKQNRIGLGDGWHPYTVSLSIVNWIYSYYLFENALVKDEEFKKELLKNIFCKAKYLSYNLEYHVLGNHLLENGRALVFAGMFFEGKLADEWLKKGTEVLWKQTEEQILNDGGHFELSPMYHTIVLWDYLECINLLLVNNRIVPKKVLDKIEKMLDFQKDILHPDKKNPLLNDSTFDIGPKPLEVLHFGSAVLGKNISTTDRVSCKLQCILGKKIEEVEPSDIKFQPVISFKDSGYYILRNSNLNSFVIIDCGRPCPDYLPAHAHSDMLSYELSLNGERFIVDSGVYQYQQGQYRDYFRSTSAHNTVTVNDQNQADVWGSFRVGQRGRPLIAEIKQHNGATVFKGSHDSYFRRYGATHTRYVAEIDNHFWMVVDELSVKEKQKDKKFNSYIHFHPNVSLNRELQEAVDLQFHEQLVKILPFGIKDIKKEVIKSDSPIFSYSQNFGEFLPNLTLKLSIKHNEPVVFGYIILPSAKQNSFSKAELSYRNLDDYEIDINFDDSIWRFQKNKNTVEINPHGR